MLARMRRFDAPSQGPLDDVLRKRQVERFDEIFESPATDRFDRRRQIAVSGDDDNRRRADMPAEMLDRGEAIHAGEPHVENQQIGRLMAGGFEPRFGR